MLEVEDREYAEFLDEDYAYRHPITEVQDALTEEWEGTCTCANGETYQPCNDLYWKLDELHRTKEAIIHFDRQAKRLFGHVIYLDHFDYLNDGSESPLPFVKIEEAL